MSDKQQKTFRAKVKYSQTKPRPKPYFPKIVSAPALEEALKKNPQAKKNFDAMSQVNQRRFAVWILLAKRPETQAKRLQERLYNWKQNQKLGLV